MKAPMRAPLATAVAIAVGLVVLLGYFLPGAALSGLRSLFLGWGVILAGIAALVGIVNLLRVHWMKFNTPKKRNIFSLILILSFLITFGMGLWLTPANPAFQKVVTHIQVPLETSLLAVLVIVLTIALIQLVRRKNNLMTIVFLCSAVVFLILGSGLLSNFGDNSFIQQISGFLKQLPLAGARGILLGIALGSLTTGLRLLIGADRPYSG